ncbi:MAG TPA: TrkA family potassium uptake protein [Gemmatimonadaceae bacterium]|nr:TrkA family potassium uptake protein [Gemmatimonadaceae bacterium]
MKRFFIIGLGNFGSTIAEALHAEGHDVVAVDRKEEVVERIAPRVTRAAVADGQSLSTLERLGARDAAAAVVSTGDDITASILSTLVLRDLGVPEVYVKVVSSEHARVMEKLGATETIFPERDSAMRLATRISSTAILNYVRLGPDFSIQEMAVPRAWIGKNLRQLRLPQRFRISVVAVHDVLADRIVPAPSPDAPLKDSDTLLLAGDDEDLARAAKEE